MEHVSRVSSGIDPSSIKSTHYFGGSTLEAVTENSYSNANVSLFPQPCFAFDNLSTAQTYRELMAFSYDPYLIVKEDGDIGIVVATSSNKWIFKPEDLEKGAVFTWEDTKDYIDAWKAATEQNRAIGYEVPEEGMRLWEGPEGKINYEQFGMTNLDIYVKDFFYRGPINDVGKNLSNNANREQTLRNALFRDRFHDVQGYNQATEALVEYFESLGLGPIRKLIGHGVEELEEGTVAATLPMGNSAILIASKDIYTHCEQIAKQYGLEGDEATKLVEIAIWYHEFYHVADRRKGKSNRSVEQGLAEALTEFFSELEANTKGSLQGFYRAMKEKNQDRARRFKYGKNKSSNAEFNMESYVRQYVSEAAAMGLNEEEAKLYVASKLEREVRSMDNENIDSSNGGDPEGEESEGKVVQFSKYSKSKEYNNSEKGTAKDSEAEPESDGEAPEGDAEGEDCDESGESAEAA